MPVEEVSLLDPVRESGSEHGDDRDEAHRHRDERREERLEPAVQRASATDENDRRGERDDEDVERELGDVPPEIPKNFTELVSGFVDGRVGAEQLLRRTPGADLHGKRSDAETHSDAVEPPKPRNRRPDSSSLEHSEQERRKENSGKQRNRLNAGREGKRQECEQDDDSSRRGPLEGEHEHEHDGQEERIEDVLGHDRAGVGE